MIFNFLFLFIIQSVNALWCEKVDNKTNTIYYQPIDGNDCSILGNGYDKNSLGANKNTITMYNIIVIEYYIISITYN